MSVLTPLSHFWRINLAVVLGAAVATAVLTGALLVGDSVRGSLRDLTLDRLGKIDYALVTQKYFREDLLVDLATSKNFSNRFETIASAILSNGTAIHSSSKTRASNINIIAVDAQFFSFFERNESASLRKKSGQVFPSVVINQALQNQLKAEVGDQILLSFEKPSDIARSSLLGRKSTEDVIETTRMSLTKIIPDEGPGRFSLQANQNLPLNAFVSLPALQRTLGQKNKVNAILVSQQDSPEANDSIDFLQQILAASLSFEDFGLKFIELEGGFAVESSESILSPQIVTGSKSAADKLNLPALPVYTYLANKMEAKGRLLPYSTVAALPIPVVDGFGNLLLNSGRPAPRLADNEILLNDWAARDLRVSAGDSITMEYFGIGPRDNLFTKQTAFHVKGVVAMAGLAIDKTLTPDFPGIADADNMADWDPPFPVDLNLIRSKDEDYWDKYRGAPKGFVSVETGRKLWGSRFGNVTSLRFAVNPESETADVEELFANEFLANVRPEQFDFVFQPVKAQGLASSKGATDFSGLFVGFSFFLIISAALLVGLLFRLGVEQRGREIGMLLAVGFPLRKVRRQFMSEGAVLAVIGALLGTGGALFYTWLLMTGLRTWWLAAVGSPFLFLHVTPASLATGFGSSLLVIFLSIWIGLRKLSKIPPPALLAGVTNILKQVGASRRAKVTAISALILAGVLTVATFSLESAAAGLFFGIGTLVLVSGLAFFAIWLRGPHRALSSQAGSTPIVRMAARNSPRNPGRSMLSTALVSSACFVIIAVGAFRTEFGGEVFKRNSGAGGYSLTAQSDIPLFYDLNSEDGRFELGFSDDDSEKLKQTEIMPFRFLPGDDASCLNLYQVEKPRILGVTQAQVERGGFKFSKTVSQETKGLTNLWNLLNMEIEPDVIPAFGDENSVMWILHSGLGKDIAISNEFGEEIKLRFVGLLKKSIFQSELLISEKNFLKHFPSRSGYSYFLIDSPIEQYQEASQILESSLSDYGFDATTTAEKLANFQAVENTYLSTFQMVGGLGLILGTLGLGMILIRNVIERRGELATLRAFGFRQSTLAALVLAENGFLLILGILLGAISAVIAVTPHILADASQVPWLSLSLTLVVVFVVGMLASLAAVRFAIKIPLLPALKAE